MKLITKGTIAGALVLLMVPAAAIAGPCYPYSGREIRYEQRDIHNDRRDMALDRYNLHRDLVEGRYSAARAQEADIRHEMGRYARRPIRASPAATVAAIHTRFG